MKTNERNKEQKTDITNRSGGKSPNMKNMGGEAASGKKSNEDIPGVKPRTSGRQGSRDVQDGGQDMGSSAGKH
ncbi:MAG: hypothetical protein ACO1O1_00395 [Adhaeribacter sp.]